MAGGFCPSPFIGNFTSEHSLQNKAQNLDSSHWVSTSLNVLAFKEVYGNGWRPMPIFLCRRLELTQAHLGRSKARCEDQRSPQHYY